MKNCSLWHPQILLLKSFSLRSNIKHETQCFITRWSTSKFLKNDLLRVVFATLFLVFWWWNTASHAWYITSQKDFRKKSDSWFHASFEHYDDILMVDRGRDHSKIVIDLSNIIGKGAIRKQQLWLQTKEQFLVVILLRRTDNNTFHSSGRRWLPCVDCCEGNLQPLDWICFQCHLLSLTSRDKRHVFSPDQTDYPGSLNMARKKQSHTRFNFSRDKKDSIPIPREKGSI